MIEIDGSYGEGGGAILRHALALSAYTGTPVSVVRIRAGRDVPGLRPQHLKSVEALGAICGARVTGATLGSSQLTFVPGTLRPGRYQFDIGTAGATTLLLQTLLLPCLLGAGSFEFGLIGGTDVPYSPPTDYLANVMLPALRGFGNSVVAAVRRGYYPKGGGKLGARIDGGAGARSPFTLIDSGVIREIRGLSHASGSLSGRRVAERQADAAHQLLDQLGHPIDIKIEYSETQSPGSGITLWAESANGTVLGSSALGARAKVADEVGREAANELLSELRSGGAVDRHLADQLIPYLAIAGGVIRTSDVSDHTRTAIYVVQEMLTTEFAVDGPRIMALPKAS